MGERMGSESKKLMFADEVLHIVRHLYKVIFNINSTLQIEKMFGMTDVELANAIRKISMQLPNCFFEPAHRKKLDEIKIICAREFIFFQVQEDSQNPHYQDDL